MHKAVRLVPFPQQRVFFDDAVFHDSVFFILHKRHALVDSLPRGDLSGCFIRRIDVMILITFQQRCKGCFQHLQNLFRIGNIRALQCDRAHSFRGIR